MENGTQEVTGISLPTIKFVTAVPEGGRGRSRAGEGSAYQKFMKDMPAPVAAKGKNGQPQIASFFVPAEVPATITDPAERDKAGKDNCQKLVNRFTSIARRIRKDNADTHDFTFRKSRDPSVTDGTGAWGIIVYRVQPGTDKGG